MKKYSYLIIIVLISSLVLTGCLLSNISQVPATDQSGITYLTKTVPPVLVAQWSFDEGTGQTVADGTGVNHGQLGSTAVVDANDPSWVVSPFFGYGNALSFDGVNDYVIVADSDSLDITGMITIEARVKPTAVNGYRTIVSKRSSSVANYALRLWDGKVEFYYRKAGATQWSEWCTTAAPVSVGNPYHIAVTYTFGQGASIIVYVNGTSYGGSWIYGVSEDVTANTFPVYIGSIAGSQYFAGTIDEVLICGSALTPPEGLITINSNALYTNSISVTLNLAATDAVGVTGYRVANGTDASGGTTVVVPSATSFSADIPWDLIAGDGTKTVAVQYRDVALNWSPNYTNSIILDQTPPVVTVTLPNTGLGVGVYLLNEVVSADWSATDALSGVVPPSTGTISIDTSSVGTGKILTIAAGTAIDFAGNQSLVVSVPYSVGYDFIGFLPPVDNPPTVNVVKAGRTIPVKWQLTDADGEFISSLSVVVYNPLHYRLINCENGVSTDEVDATTTGATSLRYDSTNNQYVFNWQTSSAFANKCYELLLNLDDGTQYSAQFHFTK